jgi:hypothetical protein
MQGRGLGSRLVFFLAEIFDDNDDGTDGIVEELNS